MIIKEAAPLHAIRARSGAASDPFGQLFYPYFFLSFDLNHDTVLYHKSHRAISDFSYYFRSPFQRFINIIFYFFRIRHHSHSP